jgi:hypothetical protein
MNDEKNGISEVAAIIAKDFEITGSVSLIPLAETENLQEFKIYLTGKLSELMENKYDTLLNILYRIDVNEKKLSELFSGKNREYIPEALADLVIERQMQKVYFRKRFKEGNI